MLEGAPSESYGHRQWTYSSLSLVSHARYVGIDHLEFNMASVRAPVTLPRCLRATGGGVCCAHTAARWVCESLLQGVRGVFQLLEHFTSRWVHPLVKVPWVAPRQSLHGRAILVNAARDAARSGDLVTFKAVIEILDTAMTEEQVPWMH